MNSYQKLINQIKNLGYEAYYLNGTIEIKTDSQDEECLAILYIQDTKIKADTGQKQIELCELTNPYRQQIIATYLEDPWNYQQEVYWHDLPE
jgi:hypothetical protein